MAEGDIDFGSPEDAWLRIESLQRKKAVLHLSGGDLGIPSNNGSAKSAFNDTRVVQFFPLTGWTFTYNINPDIVEVTEDNGATVVNEGCCAHLSSGTDPAGKARIETVRGSRYIPGIGALDRFTAVFGTPQENSIQIIGIGNGTDGWFFGYDGLKFGVMRRKNSVDEWTYQADWNVDGRDELNPQTGNVYQIKYQWLGYGMQYFAVENEFGEIQDVHRIKYANEFTEPSVANPNLPLSATVENLGNTTDIVLSTPSAIAGLDGDAFNDALSVNQADDRERSIGAAGTLIPVLAFRMADLYKLKANRLFAQALRLTFATEGNKPVAFRFWAGGTITGGTWNYIDEDRSPLESNKDFTAFTPGRLIGTFGLGKADSYQVDLSPSQFRLYPGSTITVTCSTTSTAADIIHGFNWKVFV